MSGVSRYRRQTGRLPVYREDDTHAHKNHRIFYSFVKPTRDESATATAGDGDGIRSQRPKHSIVSIGESAVDDAGTLVPRMPHMAAATPMHHAHVPQLPHRPHQVTIEEVTSDQDDGSEDAQTRKNRKRDERVRAAYRVRKGLPPRAQLERVSETAVSVYDPSSSSSNNMFGTPMAPPSPARESNSGLSIKGLLSLLLLGSMTPAHSPIITRYWATRITSSTPFASYVHELFFARVQLVYYEHQHVAFFENAPHLWVPTELITAPARNALLLLCYGSEYVGDAQCALFRETVSTPCGQCLRSRHRFAHDDMLTELLESMRVSLARDMACEIMRVGVLTHRWTEALNLVTVQLQRLWALLRSEVRTNNTRACLADRRMWDGRSTMVYCTLEYVWCNGMQRAVDEYQRRGEQAHATLFGAQPGVFLENPI